jgi:HlyD family secretion protein
VVTPGTPLLEVGDAAALELVVDLLSTDAVQVRPGAPLLVTDWGGADTLRGSVRYLEPAAFTRVSALGVEEQRVNVVGDLHSVPSGLGDGYRVEVAAVVSEAANAVKAPTSALFEQDGRWYVFVVEDGRARLRTVGTGRRGSGETEVLSGLAPGEQVIRYPADELADGTRVRRMP